MFKAILKTVKQEKSKSTTSDSQDISNIPAIAIVQQIEQIPQFSKSILDFSKFQVLNTIDSVYYIKNILTQQQQDYILNQIYNQNQRWVELVHSQRRVQKYGGDVSPSGLKNFEHLPDFLQQLSTLCYMDQQNIKINHVLINEYPPGIGIQSHFDGPLYYPFVNIFSLCSDCVFKFTKDDRVIKLFVQSGSLLMFTKEAYTQWLHGIDYYESDTILLKVEDGNIISSDLENFDKADLEKLIDQNDIYPLAQNEMYNKALMIKRKHRVSITMRNV